MTSLTSTLINKRRKYRYTADVFLNFLDVSMSVKGNNRRVCFLQKQFHQQRKTTFDFVIVKNDTNNSLKN